MPLQVLSWGSIVLGWLHMTAQHSAADQRALIIEAFAAWVRLGLLYEQNLPSQEVQGLLNLTFQCLLDSSESELNSALQHFSLLLTIHRSLQAAMPWPHADVSTVVLGACHE